MFHPLVFESPKKDSNFNIRNIVAAVSAPPIAKATHVKIAAIIICLNILKKFNLLN